MAAPTAHIAAEVGMIADRVLLPGDPRRAEHIASTFLSDVTCYNNVRNMSGYTGRYRGQRVSVQGAGMGMPSVSLYATELFRFYGVTRAVRVGTCGAISKDLRLHDIVIGTAAHTDSAMIDNVFRPVHFAPHASFELACAAWSHCRTAEIRASIGPIFSTDTFYDADPATYRRLAEHGTLAVDMEAAALYFTASAHHAEALTLLTVTDGVDGQNDLTADARQNSLDTMLSIALETLISEY